MTRSLSSHPGPRFHVCRVTSKLKLVERSITFSETHVVVHDGDALKRTVAAEQVERVSLQRGATRSLILLRVLPTTPPSPDVLLSVPTDGVHMLRSGVDTFCAPATFAQEIVAAVQRTRPDFPCVAPGVSLQATARLAHGPYAKITMERPRRVRGGHAASEGEAAAAAADSSDEAFAERRRQRRQRQRRSGAERQLRSEARREEESETDSDSECAARRRRRRNRAPRCGRGTRSSTPQSQTEVQLTYFTSSPPSPELGPSNPPPRHRRRTRS
eukprot:Rhum_TRINITY_DN2968_c0_g1::Rhum_TRINITY_DN2968_c0_g1_i1::g.9070::m.9070